MIDYLTRILCCAAISTALLSATHQASAQSPALERWRSYAGVSWDIATDGKAPAAFAGSVAAPIAGLHFAADGTAFVSTPRLLSASAPATLSILDTQVDGGPARLTAFPSQAGNATNGNPEQSLRNVLGFHVDRVNGWLWALDMGFIAGEAQAPVGSQKLLVLDLKTGKLIKHFALDAVADRAGSFLNDVTVDAARRVAYISDSGLRSAPDNLVGIIVADFASGAVRRVLHKHPTLQVESGVKVIAAGAEVWPGNPLLLGINGIALSPDGETLYWTVTTGTQAYAIRTALLRQPNADMAQLNNAVRALGVVGGNTDGIVTDPQGKLYITDVTHNGIVEYAPGSGKMLLIAGDPGIHWPDTPDIHPDGNLYFTSSALNDHFAGRVKAGRERFELWRLRLNTIH